MPFLWGDATRQAEVKPGKRKRPLADVDQGRALSDEAAQEESIKKGKKTKEEEGAVEENEKN